MRTSIDIDEDIFYQTKKFALDSKKSFAKVIEDALRTMLLKKNIANKPKSVISLITKNGTGLHHGVDLDNNQSLSDIMDD